LLGVQSPEPEQDVDKGQLENLVVTCECACPNQDHGVCITVKEEVDGEEKPVNQYCTLKLPADGQSTHTIPVAPEVIEQYLSDKD
jgi:hypothetical protein